MPFSPKKERLLSEYQIMATNKEAMNVQLVIMEGEKNDFEAQIYQLEAKELAANQ